LHAHPTKYRIHPIDAKDSFLLGSTSDLSHYLDTSMAAPPIRIVVVDDNEHYRKTVSNILGKNAHLKIVGEAEDGLGAIQAVEKLRPDVVLMDISMPVMDGIDATWVIKSKFPEIRVIILTMHDLDCFSAAAFKAGAFWCLNKECSPNEIIKAIRTAAN